VESIYAYYRDSERPGVVAIRDLLEAWFREVPLNEQLDIQQRFRSRMERQYRSAMFELFLHHFLLRCGFHVAFHPDVPGTPRHPDFLVSREGQDLFYLEAIAVSNSEREEVETNLMNRVYDVLNDLASPDFYLGMHLDGAPETQPAGARLRGELARWLATLDRLAIQQSYVEEKYEDIPTYEWEHDGWRIIFEPMPKGDAAREDTSVRPLAMAMPMQARQLRLDEALKDAVVKKDRYGRLPLPLVVAVQVIDEFRIDTIAVMDGLFGPEAIGIDEQGQQRPGRVPDGAWVSLSGPRHRTISAVMAWSTLDPWTFSRVEPIVAHNPYASMPLPTDTLPVAQHVVDRQRDVLILQPGISMEQVLGLATDWLPGD
jgi:hypothetical protein